MLKNVDTVHQTASLPTYVAYTEEGRVQYSTELVLI